MTKKIFSTLKITDKKYLIKIIKNVKKGFF